MHKICNRNRAVHCVTEDFIHLDSSFQTFPLDVVLSYRNKCDTILDVFCWLTCPNSQGHGSRASRISCMGINIQYGTVW